MGNLISTLGTKNCKAQLLMWKDDNDATWKFIMGEAESIARCYTENFQ